MPSAIAASYAKHLKKYERLYGELEAEIHDNLSRRAVCESLHAQVIKNLGYDDEIAGGYSCWIWITTRRRMSFRGLRTNEHASCDRTYRYEKGVPERLERTAELWWRNSRSRITLKFTRSGPGEEATGIESEARRQFPSSWLHFV